MNNRIPPTDAQPFASFAALKSAHTALQARYRKVLGEHSVHDENGSLLNDLFPEIVVFLKKGRATGALIDAEDQRNISQTYLDHWVSVLYRNGLQGEESAGYSATLDEFNPDLSPDLRDKRCPYLGLDAFQEQDFENFFGRKKLVEEMVARLAERRVLAVVGPSGSGKSSAVLAGLLPALKSGALPGSAYWRYYPPMVPGSNPLRNLVLALGPPEQDPALWVERQVDLFSQDSAQLRKLVEARDSRPCVIVVDQFEEVFTLCHDQTQLEHFINNLLELVASDANRHLIVLTLRSDYEEQLPRLQSLYPFLRDNRVQVMPLSAADLRDAIEKPAENIGLKFEQGIVDRLVKEIVGEPAGLPLLQFTLLQLWNRRRRNRITWDVYEQLGGPRQALTKTADEFYAALIPQEQVVTRKILIRLGWAAEGIDVLRDRVRRSELYAEVGSKDQVNEVLKKLVNARLVRLTVDPLSTMAESPNDQFEVAHEALIRNWLMLIGWLKEEHETLRQRFRLRAAAEQWRLHQFDPGALLGGALLADALRYRRELRGLEADFVDASQSAAEAAERAKQEAHDRELEQVAMLAAERQRRIDQKTRATRWLIALVALLTLALMSTAVFAFSARSNAQYAKAQRVIAEQIAIEATKQEGLARKSEQEFREQKTRAEDIERIAAAAEKKALEDSRAFDNYRRQEAERIADAARKKQLEADAARADAIAAKQLATDKAAELAQINVLMERKIIQLNEARNEVTRKNEDLLKETEAKDKALTRAAFEKNYAERLRELAVDKQVEAEQTIQRLENVIKALSAHTTFSSDGSKVITLSSDQTVRSTGAKALSREQVMMLLKKTQIIVSSDLEAPPSNQKKLAADKPSPAPAPEAPAPEQKVRVWDTISKSLTKEITASGVAAALSGDGKKVATVTASGDVVVTDVATGMALKTIPAVLPNPNKMEFSPDSARLAILGDHGEAKVLDLKTGKVVVSLNPSGKQIVDIAFSPNGQYLSTTDIAQENTLVKIGENQQLQVPLATGKCRPFTLEVLQISPSPDLKAQLAVARECAPGGDKVWKLVMDVYSRLNGGSFQQLAHVSYTGQLVADSDTLRLLAVEGLKDEQIRLIGEQMKDFGKKAAALENLDQQTRTIQLLELSSQLFGQVVRDLGISPQ